MESSALTHPPMCNKEIPSTQSFLLLPSIVTSKGKCDLNVWYLDDGYVGEVRKPVDCAQQWCYRQV